MAVPYNRRWPGHQRTMDQSEMISFLSFAMDEPVEIEIEVEEAFEQVIVRPLSLGIVPQTEGITIRDSLVYNIRPLACRNLTIRNVKIIGCWRFNSDGIDMHNCEDVLIEHCFPRTFDDSICVKGFDCYYEGDLEAEVRKRMYRSGESYGVFRHVRVRNLTIWNDWGKCLEIGAETRTTFS